MIANLEYGQAIWLMVSPFTQFCSCCRKLTMLCFKDQRNELQPLAFRSIARRALGPPPQTTVRVLVRYPKEAGGKVSVKTHCFVSDDGKHPNSLALKKCLRTLLQSTFIFALTDVVVISGQFNAQARHKFTKHFMQQMAKDKNIGHNYF
jgi:hypothetical protein